MLPPRFMPRLALLLPLLALSTPTEAADARLQFLVKQLQKATDARARAQAALMLGQAGDPSSVPPLCQALSDQDDVVKTAAAKSLDALGEVSALGCLRSASAGRAQGAVKAAIASLEALKSRPATLYVALEPPENRAELSADLIDLLVGRLKARFVRLGALFAPANESKAAAQKVIKGKKLKGVLVMPTVEKVGAGISLTLVALSYPERSIKGQVTVKAAGGQPADLIRALAPKAVDDAADEFEWGE